MREESWLSDEVFVVREFLTPTECQQYIEISEDIGFEEALVTTARGAARIDSIRNNDRVMFKNQEVAHRLWERAADFVPSEWEGRQAVGVNELLRFYRYDVGQQFNWHQDFPYERDNGEASQLTIAAFLEFYILNVRVGWRVNIIVHNCRFSCSMRVWIEHNGKHLINVKF